MSWSKRFDVPIALPDGATLQTLDDARRHLLALPRARHRDADVVAAIEAVATGSRWGQHGSPAARRSTRPKPRGLRLGLDLVAGTSLDKGAELDPLRRVRPKEKPPEGGYLIQGLMMFNQATINAAFDFRR